MKLCMVGTQFVNSLSGRLFVCKGSELNQYQTSHQSSRCKCLRSLEAEVTKDSRHPNYLSISFQTQHFLLHSSQPLQLHRGVRALVPGNYSWITSQALPPSYHLPAGIVNCVIIMFRVFLILSIIKKSQRLY